LNINEKTMKKNIFLIGTVFCACQVSGQVGINIEAPHPSSVAPTKQGKSFKPYDNKNQ